MKLNTPKIKECVLKNFLECVETHEFYQGIFRDISKKPLLIQDVTFDTCIFENIDFTDIKLENVDFVDREGNISSVTKSDCNPSYEGECYNRTRLIKTLKKVNELLG